MNKGRLDAIRARAEGCLTKTTLMHADNVAAHEDRLQLLIFVELLMEAFDSAGRVNGALRRENTRLKGLS